MAARAKSCGEVADNGSIKMTKLTLSSYANKTFCAVSGDNAWYLTGDAAMGVPYFRSLNCGMMLSSRLAQIFIRAGKKYGWGSPKMQQRSHARFDFHRTLHVPTEFSIASSKNAILTTYNLWRKASAAKPWQTIKWSEAVMSGYQPGAALTQAHIEAMRANHQARFVGVRGLLLEKRFKEAALADRLQLQDYAVKRLCERIPVCIRNLRLLAAIIPNKDAVVGGSQNIITQQGMLFPFVQYSIAREMQVAEPYIGNFIAGLTVDLMNTPTTKAFCL